LPLDDNLREVAVTTLLFDPRNPRLVSDEDEELSQSECARRLLDDFDPLPIGRSIAAFGFFPTDPLVGREVDDDFVVVHEGNRRLLAVRLLTDANLRAELDADPQWLALAETLDPDVAASLERLPTYIVDDWKKAAPIIGVRHIVGIETWKSYEKAAFVRQLLARTPEGVPSIKWASSVTGESEARIRRYLRDYQVLAQAEAAGIDVASARERFGNFTRLVSTNGVIDYLRLVPPREVDEDTETAYLSPDGNVQEVLSFAFGSDDNDPVLADHRQYRELGAVLASDEARDHLERTRDLETSLAMTTGVRDRVLRHLSRALDALASASNDLQRLEVDEAVDEIIRELREAITLLESRQPLPRRTGTLLPVDEDFDLDEPDEDE
jgi:hypothetical protein